MIFKKRRKLINKKSILRSMFALLASIMLFTALLSVNAFADVIYGSNSGGGSSDVHSGDWYDDQVGYRFSIVNSKGQQVGGADGSVDFLFCTQKDFNSISKETLSTSNRKFGKEAYRTVFLGNLRGDALNKTSRMPKPIVYDSSSGKMIGNGGAFRDWIKGGSGKNNLTNVKAILNRAAFKDVLNKNEKKVDKTSDIATYIQTNGYRIIVEPITWYKPANWNGGMSNQYNKYIYGTAANIANWYAKNTEYSKDGGFYGPIISPLCESMRVLKGSKSQIDDVIQGWDYGPTYFGNYVDLITLNGNVKTWGFAAHIYSFGVDIKKDVYDGNSITSKTRTRIYKLENTGTGTQLNMKCSNPADYQKIYNKGIMSATYNGSFSKNGSKTIKAYVATIKQTTKQTYKYIMSNGNQVKISGTTKTYDPTYSRINYKTLSSALSFTVTAPTIKQTYYSYYDYNKQKYVPYNGSKTNLGSSAPKTSGNDVLLSEDGHVKLKNNSTYSFTFKAGGIGCGVPNVGSSVPDVEKPFDTAKVAKTGCFKQGTTTTNINGNISKTFRAKTKGYSFGHSMSNASGIPFDVTQSGSNFTVKLSNFKTIGAISNTKSQTYPDKWAVDYQEGKLYTYGVKYSGSISTSKINNANKIIDATNSKAEHVSKNIVAEVFKQPILKASFKVVDGTSVYYETETNDRDVLVRVDSTVNGSIVKTPYNAEAAGLATLYDYYEHFQSYQTSFETGSYQFYTNNIRAKYFTIEHTKKYECTKSSNGKISKALISQSYNKINEYYKENTVKYQSHTPLVTQTWYRPYDLNTNGAADDEKVKEEFPNYSASENLNMVVNNNQGIIDGDAIQLNKGETYSASVNFKNDFYGFRKNILTSAPGTQGYVGSGIYSASIFNQYDIVKRSSAFIPGNNQAKINIEGKQTVPLRWSTKTDALKAGITSSTAKIKIGNGTPISGPSSSLSIPYNSRNNTLLLYSPEEGLFDLNNGTQDYECWTFDYNQCVFYSLGVNYTVDINMAGVGNAKYKEHDMICKKASDTFTQPVLYGTFESKELKVETDTEVDQTSTTVLVKVKTDSDGVVLDNTSVSLKNLFENENNYKTYNYKGQSGYNDANGLHQNKITATYYVINKLRTRTITKRGNVITYGKWSDPKYTLVEDYTDSNTIKYQVSAPTLVQQWYRPFNLNTNTFAKDSFTKSYYPNFVASGNLKMTANNNQNITNGSSIKILDTNHPFAFNVRFNSNYYGWPTNMSSSNPYGENKDKNGHYLPSSVDLPGATTSHNGLFTPGTNCESETITGKKSSDFRWSSATIQAGINNKCASLQFGSGKEALIGESINVPNTSKGGNFNVRAISPESFNLNNGKLNSKAFWEFTYNQGLFYTYGIKYKGTINLNGVSDATETERNIYCKLSTKKFVQPILYGKFKADTVGGGLN